MPHGICPRPKAGDGKKRGMADSRMENRQQWTAKRKHAHGKDKKETTQQRRPVACLAWSEAPHCERVPRAVACFCQRVGIGCSRKKVRRYPDPQRELRWCCHCVPRSRRILGHGTRYQWDIERTVSRVGQPGFVADVA